MSYIFFFKKSNTKYMKILIVRQVSMMSGVPKSTVQKLMDENSNPTLATLEKLAAGLKCKISDLYESDYK